MTYKAEAPTKKSDQLGFRPKRFWKATAVVPSAGGFAVALDGRTVKTPSGAELILPNAVLAGLVEAEWAAVGDHVDYETMPLTRFGFASVGRMGEVLDATIAEVLRYAETDLVCYPSEYPEALIVRENAAWLPLLAWAETELRLRFVQNHTLIHAPQPPETVARLRDLVPAMTQYQQAGLMAAIPLFGSVVLALALLNGRLSGDAAYNASRIGEDFQAETWGRDEEAAKRAGSHRVLAVSLDQWFRALA